jgi:hypothetical protein
VLRNKAVLVSILCLICLSLGASSACAGEITYDSGKRRDPFVALKDDGSGDSPVSSSGFKLEGIIYDPGSKSLAILSGKTYQAGETVGETKIVSISKDHVVISEAGEEKTLWIRSEGRS